MKSRELELAKEAEARERKIRREAEQEAEVEAEKAARKAAQKRESEGNDRRKKEAEEEMKKQEIARMMADFQEQQEEEKKLEGAYLRSRMMVLNVANSYSPPNAVDEPFLFNRCEANRFSKG